MEELRRKFAENLYEKACVLADCDFDELGKGDELYDWQVEEAVIGVCEAVFKEMIFVETFFSEKIFVTLPTDKEDTMSRVCKELPPALQKRVKE